MSLNLTGHEVVSWHHQGDAGALSMHHGERGQRLLSRIIRKACLSLFLKDRKIKKILQEEETHFPGQIWRITLSLLLIMDPPCMLVVY